MTGRSLPGRRLWLLVLLAAVLSMHGLQYMSPAAAPEGRAAVGHTTSDTAAGPLLAGAAALGEDLARGADGVRAAASQVLSGEVPTHGLPAHVWTLCLAVLLAGLALLALASRRASPSPVHDLVRRVLVPVDRSRALRPPDLASLCLLRI